jgi:hypothetical protein
MPSWEMPLRQDAGLWRDPKTVTETRTDTHIVHGKPMLLDEYGRYIDY